MEEKEGEGRGGKGGGQGRGREGGRKEGRERENIMVIFFPPLQKWCSGILMTCVGGWRSLVWESTVRHSKNKPLLVLSYWDYESQIYRYACFAIQSIIVWRARPSLLLCTCV